MLTVIEWLHLRKETDTQHITASLSATKTEEKEQKNRDKLQKTDMQTY